MLEVQGLTKSFPGVLALDDVSATFDAGEIHAVIGENGAGKSTLIKLICGIYEPDSGTTLRGLPRNLGNRLVVDPTPDSQFDGVLLIHAATGKRAYRVSLPAPPAPPLDPVGTPEPVVSPELETEP